MSDTKAGLEFREFLAEPRQRPSEIERARMRRVLAGPPAGGAKSEPDSVSSDSVSSAIFSELRAMRSELSTLCSLLTRRGQANAVPVDDEVLTRSQAAKVLRVCSESVTRLVRDEGLPCRRVGKEYRFLRSELVTWLAAREAVAAGDE